jgi:hypothetical protein
MIPSSLGSDSIFPLVVIPAQGSSSSLRLLSEVGEGVREGGVLERLRSRRGAIKISVSSSMTIFKRKQKLKKNYPIPTGLRSSREGEAALPSVRIIIVNL